MEEGIIQVGEGYEAKVPRRKLLKHKGIVACWPEFGPAWHYENVSAMERGFYPRMDLNRGLGHTFREATTRETITLLEYDSRSLDFEYGPLQIGRMEQCDDGIFVNTPKFVNGKPVRDVQILKSFLKNCKKIRVGKGFIYLNDNDFGFAERGSFQMGSQDIDVFANEGLGKILEHTKRTAKVLKNIVSKKPYSDGVNVHNFGFRPNTFSCYEVLCFKSQMLGKLRLDIFPSNPQGYAFAILRD